MARRPRYEANRAGLDAIDGAMADGMADMIRGIVRRAETMAPDADPYGEGLVTRGGGIVWSGGKQVAVVLSGDGRKPEKPRDLRVRSAASSIVGVAGFGFPAMFQEFGTVHHPPQPFFTPAVSEELGDAEVTLSEAFQRRLRGERSPMTAVIAQRKAAAAARKATT